jgi:hypothetical protein
MSSQEIINQSVEKIEQPSVSKRHPVTTENSPDETIKRMRALPDRAARLREALDAVREANPR